MADIPIKFYKSVVRSQKFNPSNPPDLEDPAPVVNPPGSLPTTLFKLLGDVTDTDFVGKNGFIPVVVDDNVLTLQSLSTNVLGTLLTGYLVGANTAISSSNTILTAFQQVQGQINARVSGTIASGQVAFGTGVNTIGGENALWWDATNNRLGIGTITPEELLDIISGNIRISRGRKIGGYYASHTNGGTLSTDYGNYVGSTFSGMRINTSWDGAFNDEDISFYTHDGGTSAGERVRILRSGNVGIGTSSPSGTLHVNGTIPDMFIGDVTTTNVNNLRGFRMQAFSNGSLYIDCKTYSGGKTFFRAGQGTEAGDIRNWMTLINASGNVGFNQITPTEKVHIGGSLRIDTITNGTGDFLTKSATGVITSRTAAQVLTDIGGIGGSGTINEIAYFTDTRTIASLPVATYPSLTELSYVKGLTSTAQTQINGKQATIAGTLTDTYVATIVAGVPTWAAPAGGSKWTDVGVGNIYRNSSVSIGQITDPTNKLDINGDLRIRTIANGDGYVLTTSATGVVSTSSIMRQTSGHVYIGDTSLDYVDWDDTANIFGIFSQSQFLHKYRGGAAGALNIGQFDASGNASINNTSNGKLLLATNNTTRIDIEEDGDVLLKKVDNGAGNFVTIDATTGQLRKRTAAETLNDLGGPPNAITITSTATQTINVDTNRWNNILLQSNAVIDITTISNSNYFRVILRIKQDATGSRTVTWNTGGQGIIWKNGTAPSLSGNPNWEDIVELFWDGTRINGLHHGSFG